MTEPTFDFDRLLSPLKPAEFFESHWERRPLWLRRERPDYYRELITASDLENLISDSDLRYPAIRLAKGGSYFAPEVYTHNVKHGDESFLGVPDVKRIAEEYQRGATLALPAIHRTWKALGLLCETLQARFDHPAHANVYITPGNAAGFTPHYDIHEVFVLQIAGKKRWSLYEPVTTLPHRSQLFTPQAYSGQAPTMQVELTVGDLLYLPRGFLHSTTTADGFSAHVTIGITVYTWVDLLREYLQTAVADEELRKALPPGFARREDLKPGMRRQMHSALDRLRANADLDALIDAFTNRVRAAHPPRPAPFRADVNVIGLESRLRPPPPGGYRLMQEDDKAILEFNGVRYQLPAPVLSLIRIMGERQTFIASELPPHLDADGRLVLIRHLHDIGFLTEVRDFRS